MSKEVDLTKDITQWDREEWLTALAWMALYGDYLQNQLRDIGGLLKAFENDDDAQYYVNAAIQKAKREGVTVDPVKSIEMLKRLKEVNKAFEGIPKEMLTLPGVQKDGG